MRRILLAFALVPSLAFAAPKPTKVKPAPTRAPEPRISLTLRDVPLPELLTQLSAATSLRFRFATPPDARVSASLQNAPLFSSLEDTLRSEGLAFLRDGQNAWILRANPRPPSPFKLPPRKRPRPTPRPLPLTTISQSSDGWAWRVLPNVWRRVPLEADAREWPGVRVLNVPQGDVWLRYSFRLREVPPDLRLLLSVPRPATVRINGAVLRRNAHGLSTFALSSALKRGANLLEVQWQQQRIPVSWSDAALNSTLRYEWVLGDAEVPEGASQEEAPGGFRLIDALFDGSRMSIGRHHLCIRSVR